MTLVQYMAVDQENDPWTADSLAIDCNANSKEEVVKAVRQQHNMPAAGRVLIWTERAEFSAGGVWMEWAYSFKFAAASQPLKIKLVRGTSPT